MSNWTIGKRLIVGFVAVVTVACCLGAYAFVKLQTIQADATEITADAMPGMYSIMQVESIGRENTVLLFQHITVQDATEMKGIEEQIAANVTRMDGLIAEYDKLVTSQKERELFNAIGPALADVRRVRDDVVLPLSRQGKKTEADTAIDKEFLPAFDRYAKAMRAEVALNRQSAEELGRSIDGSVDSARTGIVVGLLLAILVSAVVGWFIVSSTNRALRTSVDELTEGSQQVVAAAGQVATSSQSLSQGATEQAASLEETSASMEEMASMTRKNAENSNRAAGLMVESERLVASSNQALGEMVTSMAAISESSNQVAKIIKTIDEIAFQTNILALNAAVEAARAGEAGMGFAVVADEVRTLAQRSAQAAKDTAGLIEMSLQRSQEGNQKVQQVATAIAAITESAGNVKRLVDEVSVASRQQAQGIDQVSQAVAQMEKVTQTTAATAEESAAASEELNAQAEAAMAVVRQLEALVGGARQGRPAAAATKRAAAPSGGAKVVKMIEPRGAAKAAAASAEDLIPLADTGTYGRF